MAYVADRFSLLILWSGWSSRGRPDPKVAVAAVAAGRNQDGRQEVFVAGSDGKLWHTWQVARNDGWLGWGSLGTPKDTGVVSLAVAQNLKGSLVVLAAARDGTLQEMRQSKPSNGWVSSWNCLGVPMWSIDDKRDIAVYELSMPLLELWNRRYPKQIVGDACCLPVAALAALQVGRVIILGDSTTAARRTKVTAVAAKDLDGDGAADHVVVSYSPALAAPLQTGSAVMCGNVAKATHGETIAGEVLGDGDASARYQSFKLSRSPLTFVSDATARRGAASTLRLRVDDVSWKETRHLHGQDGDDWVFTARIDEKGVLTVGFGDGVNGALLPSGRNNLVVTYRKGLGSQGNLPAKTLTTLLDRPLGLKGVSNPAPAAGGADREGLAKARAGAPNTVRTFDRVVSLGDFEDAAREYTGISKARATWSLSGGSQTVRLVVAGDRAGTLADSVLRSLRSYLDARRDPHRPLHLESYRPLAVSVHATVQAHDSYQGEKVRAAAVAQLRSFFAFANQDIGRCLHLSDLYDLVQRVTGVVWLDIDRLMFVQGRAMTDQQFADDLKLRGASFRVAGGTKAPEPAQKRMRIWSYELAQVASPATDLVVKLGRKP